MTSSDYSGDLVQWTTEFNDTVLHGNWFRNRYDEYPRPSDFKHLRILVTGSRDWTDRWGFENALASYLRSLGRWDDNYGMPIGPITIVHGDAPGLDSIAREWAIVSCTAEEPHPADWEKHGKRAGYLRNLEMVQLGADVCLAFPLGESKGTRMCMDLARAAGIPVMDFGVANE